MLHVVLNPWTHWWGQPPWFQCCSREHLLWRIDHLNGLAGRRKRGNFYHHFTGGRLKHKEEKEGQERCKWYVQGHPGRLVQGKLIHISFHPFSLLSAHKVSALRAAWEFVVTAVMHDGYQEEPTFLQVQVLHLLLLYLSSRERNSTLLLLPGCWSSGKQGWWWCIYAEKSSRTNF